MHWTYSQLADGRRVKVLRSVYIHHKNPDPDERGHRDRIYRVWAHLFELYRINRRRMERMLNQMPEGCSYGVPNGYMYARERIWGGQRRMRARFKPRRIRLRPYFSHLFKPSEGVVFRRVKGPGVGPMFNAGYPLWSKAGWTGKVYNANRYLPRRAKKA
jgi:hypothetical protein